VALAGGDAGGPERQANPDDRHDDDENYGRDFQPPVMRRVETAENIMS
jgi:hypothetical protein